MRLAAVNNAIRDLRDAFPDIDFFQQAPPVPASEGQYRSPEQAGGQLNGRALPF